MTTRASLTAAMALLLLAGTARAEGECVKASEQAMAARDAGRLREARKGFVTCAADTCARALRIDCARWLEETDASLPTVVFGARDAHGDVFDVTVLVDGERMTGHERGRAVPLDPGPHVVRFERPGKPAVEERILLRAGEHNRAVNATFEDGGASRPPPRPASAPVPAGAIVLGALGVAALGSFVFFAATGASERSDLRGKCSPHCTDDDVGGLKTRFIVADVSLGVSVIALGVAAYLFFTRERAPASSARDGHGFFARTIWK